MKRIFFGVIFLILFLFLPQVAHAQAVGYVVRNFRSEIKVEQNTDLEVTETLLVNFSSQKHGLVRVIPFIYSAQGKTINARISVLSVSDDKGNPYQYEETLVNQSKQLKIGDPNVLVKGDKTYVIKYQMKNILLIYNDQPEVYWNVTGHEWDTVIEKAKAGITSPYAKIEKVDCFTGVAGGKEKQCLSSNEEDKAAFESQAPVVPGSDFTIMVGLSSNNSLVFPSQLVRAVDNWGYLPAVLPLVLMFLLWYWKGRDKKYVGDNIYYRPDKPKEEAVSLFSRKFLPLVYSPIKNLSPAEVGTIIDEKIDIQDIVAEVVELARLGYLKIEKVKDKQLFAKAEYAFIKVKAWQTSRLRDYQKRILDKIFAKNETRVTLASLKAHFYLELNKIKTEIYAGLVKKEIFPASPDKVRKIWLGIYLLLTFILGFVVLGFSVASFNFVPLLVLSLSFVLGLPFSLSMPRKTAWGYSLYRQITGLKDYLRLGKWREEYKEKQLFFDEILPLAISLGVVAKLASEMKALGIEPPDYFTGDIVAFNRLAAVSMLTGPVNRSGGSSWSGHSSWSGGSGFSGGSSGGGFGGGGGGSW